MERAKELKKELGSGYDFRVLLTEHEVREIMEQNPSESEIRTAAFLAAGCVKIEVTLYRQNGRVQLGYDVFVKDDPGSPEWICYASPEDTVSFKEADMLAVLDRVVTQNGLSYTECCFQKLEGGLIKTNKKKEQKRSNESAAPGE